MPAILFEIGRFSMAGFYGILGILEESEMMPFGPMAIEQGGVSGIKYLWNLGESVITKEHHNWIKRGIAFTMDEVVSIVRKAVQNGRWQENGKTILHGKTKAYVGDGVTLREIIDGNAIWVEGVRKEDGTIIINNAGVD